MPSFSFRLWAVRKIVKDEELTLSRISISAPYVARRDALLRTERIRCECFACEKRTLADPRRKAALGSKPFNHDIWDSLRRWITTPAPNIKRIIIRFLQRITFIKWQKLEQEEGSLICNFHTALFICYLALGNTERANEHRELVIKWTRIRPRLDLEISLNLKGFDLDLTRPILEQHINMTLFT